MNIVLTFTVHPPSSICQLSFIYCIVCQVFVESGSKSKIMMLSLCAGCPDSYLRGLAAELVLKATQHRIPRDIANKTLSFQYGESQGDLEFLEELAKFLTTEYGTKVLSDNLFASAGATHGLHLILSLLFRPGDVVFIEEPTYFYVTQVIPDLGFKPVPVPCDSQGMIIEELEKLINKHCPQNFQKSTEKLFKSMIYMIPVFNNPGGFSYTDDRCQELLQLTRKQNCLIVSDDVYNLLYFDDRSQAPKRLIEFDSSHGAEYKEGNVISNCTFSKLLAPSMRCGWIEASTEIVDFISNSSLVQSGGNTCQYTSTIITSALQMGLVQKQVQIARVEYKRKMTKTLEILDELVPKTVSFTKPNGGYFIWLELPDDKNAEDLLKFAEEKFHVTFHVGKNFVLL
ncbi:uncharacterized protein LOC141908191 isoform X2 [Tubulanus polymorphus]|uniref:uncharacterized protein LOC141908191 isoform X2 n=1 Tax=Tubulanus polymorphus TaxID=672921 RepID=UPI003DA48C9A